jgi:EAL domain-containing protein (putative c-di-GMP-specific phosphodiesterase class I)
VQNALKIWNVDYTQLTIEITESSLLTDHQKTFEILKKLKDMGVKISIDDFGTGYSSLSYFKNIPASELKIDQSFVSKILTSKTDRQIIKTIIAIAKEFALQVTAEGIEDEETYNMLLDLGCDVGQGFFMGRPMPLGKFVEWLNHSSLTPFSFKPSTSIDKKPSQLS